MTAVEIGGELVVLDVGADIERVKGEGKSLGDMKRGEAVEKKIVPDDSEIREREEDVVAIIVGHGHLDHCLGIPKLAGAYGCPIIATPFTISVIQRLVGDDREDIPNDLISLEPGESTNISDDIELEFIPVAHSVPQTVLPVLRTSEGTVVYSLDFKFGGNPPPGESLGEGELRELGGEGVEALIPDCTRADEPGNAGSEVSVKEKLKEILDRSYEDDEGVG
ncbi:hypothetical protein AKJ36_01860 [candidate division MSBL1 archaeon SCGC-AAA259I07]|uniref:Metallo-beta-lactamase domain-containing protein n=1 Tax=candidate division MSBL1 archaeon SCGC-AAA259I07 TaxID=1698266 RepID=A0A133ULA1_9EURY|nr:hypothetical protein AKJ36_01860 [candidate division MSBL1 archaeon SCGC-AAA259I07]